MGAGIRGYLSRPWRHGGLIVSMSPIGSIGSIGSIDSIGPMTFASVSQRFPHAFLGVPALLPTVARIPAKSRKNPKIHANPRKSQEKPA